MDSARPIPQPRYPVNGDLREGKSIPALHLWGGVVFLSLELRQACRKKHEKYPQLSGKIWKINDLHNMMLKEREVERRTADGREWMRMF
jgi:hypothetical protein